MTLRLVIFDVDGTLVDSQGDIVASHARAFEAAGRPVPARADMLALIGMSLPQTMRRLAPDASEAELDALVTGYKQAYSNLRQFAGTATSSPLYPGAAEALAALRAQDETLLAIATGKSRRGVNILIEGHGLHGAFQSVQCADDHPSKPHPSMVLTALAETGVAAADAVMVGDTTYDRDMALAAGVPFIGVSWGYHAAERLGAQVLDRFDALVPALAQRWGQA